MIFMNKALSVSDLLTFSSVILYVKSENDY